MKNLTLTNKINLIEKKYDEIVAEIEKVIEEIGEGNASEISYIVIDKNEEVGTVGTNRGSGIILDEYLVIGSIEKDEDETYYDLYDNWEEENYPDECDGTHHDEFKAEYKRHLNDTINAAEIIENCLDELKNRGI